MFSGQVRFLKNDSMKAFPKDKLYYNISEVSRITGIKAHVLRYWETEFPMLRPIKDRANRRLYKKKDLELVMEIKKLLYEENFTIKGARKKLEEKWGGSEKHSRQTLAGRLKKVREKLEQLVRVVEKNIDSLEAQISH